MRPLRLLPERCDDGATTMAWDEALLEAAPLPTLRLYTWATPTLSLGYFQDHDQVRATLPPGWTDLPVVRRITGGGAIWHAAEITYCLVGRLGVDLPTPVSAVYTALHGGIQRALAAAGAALARAQGPVPDRRYRTEPRCFAAPAPDDLTAGAGKVLGSAGRQRGERFLVHGSLKLGSNPWDGGVVAACGVPATTARTALQDGIAAALGLALTPGEPTPAETAAMAAIRAARYGSDGWVRRREGPRP